MIVPVVNLLSISFGTKWPICFYKYRLSVPICIKVAHCLHLPPLPPAAVTNIMRGFIFVFAEGGAAVSATV
jgi:hypothetical protein